MRRRLLGTISGIVTAVTFAAAAFAAISFRGPSAEDLMRDLAVVERELALAERTLAQYSDRPLIAEQVALRVALLQTTRAMLDQKRLSWLRGVKLIYRVEGSEVVPNRDALTDLEARLADAEAGMLTARTWAARSTNEVAKNMAMALEQVHLLTHAAVRQQMALEGLGMAVPPPPPTAAAALPAAEPPPAKSTPAEPAPADRGVIGALNRAASIR